MLCCAGLFAGLAAGQYLGGPWTVIAPAAGFGIGFIGDLTVMKRMHCTGGPKPSPLRQEAPVAAPAQAIESQAEQRAVVGATVGDVPQDVLPRMARAQRGFGEVRPLGIVIAFVLMAGYVLLTEHRAHAAEYLPYALLLAFPLMQLLRCRRAHRPGRGGNNGGQT